VKSERKGTITLREVKGLVLDAGVMSDLAGLRSRVTGWVGQGHRQQPAGVWKDRGHNKGTRPGLLGLHIQKGYTALVPNC